jgi:hypothetical protein
MLDTAGAKWKLVHGNLNFSDRCGAGLGLGQGVMVSLSKRASKKAIEAASVLSEALNKVLPPTADKIPQLVDAELERRIMPEEGPDAPLTLMANDPDLIVVVIGAHPRM